MKLFWSSRSPFVRKVMLFAHEAGVADRILLEPAVVTPLSLNLEVLAVNPLGQLPTMVLEDGEPMYDSGVICDHLDKLHQGEPLIPCEVGERRRNLRLQALADGLMSMLVLLRSEKAKADGARNDALIESWETRRDAAIAELARSAKSFSETRVDIAQIATFAAFGYLDFRFAAFDWRSGQLALHAWYEEFAARPSAQATRMFDPR